MRFICLEFRSGKMRPRSCETYQMLGMTIQELVSTWLGMYLFEVEATPGFEGRDSRSVSLPSLQTARHDDTCSYSTYAIRCLMSSRVEILALVGQAKSDSDRTPLMIHSTRNRLEVEIQIKYIGIPVCWTCHSLVRCLGHC